ncbi:hypothetical protein ACHAWT_009210 [Skeletonema menzelii]
MQRSHLLLQNAASKAAAAKAAGEAAVVNQHLQWRKQFGFGEGASAEVLSSRNSPHFYKPLYHHLDPSLLKPRESGSFSYLLHHLKSSFSGFYSICTSQQARDQFLHLTARSIEDINNNDHGHGEENTGIINTFVLNQSDMGFMKVMTLYQDLSNPLFDEANFDTETEVRQFLNGCSFALEQFHTVQADYLKNLEAALDTIDYSADNAESKQKSIIENVENLRAAIDTIHTNSSADNVEGEHESKTQEKGEGGFHHKFFDIVENDQESTESALASMLSPEGLDRIFFDTAMYSFVKNISGGVDSNTENQNPLALAELPSDPQVMHACLLSARVEEIEASGVNEERRNEDDNNPDAPLEDESLKPFADRKVQTILQLEVLYDLEFLTNTLDNSTDGSNNNKSFKSVNVAKFETCIKNDPNGDELQWRLCSWRPAREFGHL